MKVYQGHLFWYRLYPRVASLTELRRRPSKSPAGGHCSRPSK